ncbi:hypothetical protein Vi05172_g12956 [Venturia inaequalis]|nr:hypothetical protein Vi05172_g12956 [Venturia inaequalis]
MKAISWSVIPHQQQLLEQAAMINAALPFIRQPALRDPYKMPQVIHHSSTFAIS